MQVIIRDLKDMEIPEESIVHVKETEETRKLYVKQMNKCVSPLKKAKKVLPKFGWEKCYR